MVAMGHMAAPEAENKEAGIIAEVWKLVEPVVLAEGMELIEVEYRRESHGWVLRLFMDQDSGMSVDDCARMSDVVGDLLDVAEVIASRYHLEISSPGLNRPLRRVEHFLAQLGNVVELRTLVPMEGRRNFKGILREVTPETITMECDGQVHGIPFSQLDRARLRYFESHGD